MKKAKILIGLACALLVSCQSTDDPDQILPSDDTWSSLMTEAKNSVVYQLQELQWYTADKDADGLPANEWTPTNVYGLSAYPELMVTIDNRSWAQMPMFKSSVGILPVAVPWLAYCDMTSCEKKILVSCPVVYSNDNASVSINGFKMDIEHVSSDSLAVSDIQDYDSRLLKTVRRYSIHKLKDANLENLAPYDTERDAMLAMIKCLREYFGDIYDSSTYYKSSETTFKMDLKLLEQDIQNNDLSYPMYRYEL